MSQEFTTIQDQRLINRALRERWPINDKTRRIALEAVQHALETGDTDHKLAAVRTLLLADKLNVDLLKILLPQQHIHYDVKNLSDGELEAAIRELARVAGIEAENARPLLIEQEAYNEQSTARTD